MNKKRKAPPDQPYVQIFSTIPQTIPPGGAVQFENTIDINGFTQKGTKVLIAEKSGTYLWNYTLLITFQTSPTETRQISYTLSINDTPQDQSSFGQGFSPAPIGSNIPIVPTGTIYIPQCARISLININTVDGFISNDFVSVNVITASLTLERIGT